MDVRSAFVKDNVYVRSYGKLRADAFPVQVLVQRVRAIAERRGVKPGQLALAWVFEKGLDIVPIPGTKRRAYLEENIAAAQINLAPGEVVELEAAVPLAEVAGDRYTMANMKTVDR
jgi:aryl-alcohol dehydrogenase-like predicted oxidoreductase